jgi:hypothetical protein
MSEEPTRPAHDLDFEELDAALSEHDVEASEDRRRRPVADWGGDDLFNHVPRRRFARAGSGAHVRRPGATSATSHQIRRNSEPSSNASPRTPERDDDVSVDTPVAAHSLVDRPIVTVYEDLPSAAPAPVARVRRRPRPTVDERLGPRPDRMAAWAFALGLLLILLAVATADAATLAGF